jgi:Fur family transcriptional regulator, ferric uptake regulator
MFAGVDSLKDLLKRNGQSVTTTRLAVFEALSGQEPLSMHELVERVRSADRASVYRTIDLFERLGIVQRLNTGWKYKVELSDKFAAHHHHLTCTHCGATTPMNEAELETVIDRLARNHGFRPMAHQIEIQGICSNCQRRPGPS